MYLFGTITYLLLTSIKDVDTQTVDDPCPSSIPSSTVAEMCTDSSAVEEEPYTFDIANSVIIRMRTQKIFSCHVFFENQNGMRQFRVMRYNELSSSFPEKASCGLIIDINSFNQTNDQTIAPLECFKGRETRYLYLLPNAGLQFSSRVSEGLFDRGYCIQVIREAITGDFRLKVKCRLDETNINILQTTTQKQTHQSGTVLTESQSSIYIGIGVGSCIVVLVVIIVVIVICRRKNICKSKGDSKNNSQHNIVYNNKTDDIVYDGMRENILYVPSDHLDVHDSNYSTVNLEGGNRRAQQSNVDVNYSSIDIKVGIGRDNPKIQQNGTDTNYSSIDLNVGVERDNPKIQQNGADTNYSSIDLNMEGERTRYSSDNKSSNGKHKSTIQPKLKPSSQICDNTDFGASRNDITHIRPPTGSGDVYAVVDKRKTKNDGNFEVDHTYAIMILV